MRATLVAILATAATACGGSKTEPTAPTAPTTATTAISEPKTPPSAVAKGAEIDVFHDALAPRWHAVGPERMPSVCGALPELQTKAVAVRGAGVPGDLDAEVWGNALERIESSLTKLKPACGGTNRNAFESAFNAVHLAFHDYMDLVVGDHGHGLGDGRGGRRGIH